nr:protein FAR1-RELATED SEQUENCE 5-like [Arachis hypogaea]
MEPQTQEASNSQRHTSDQNVHNVSDHVDEDVTSDAVDMDQYRINSWEDIGKIDFSSLSMKNICQLHFADLGLAFEFYNSYAKTRGFSVRKSRSRIVDGKVREKWNHMKNRVREPKPETRCGCMSKLHVFFDAVTESWVVRDFYDEYNHDLVVPKLARMLRSHKKMTEPDISQMNHMKEVGISIPNIFGSLASQCGGYENVNFSIKDMHNQVAKQRRQLPDDLTFAMAYLETLAARDRNLFYSVEKGRKEVFWQIFWCDGRCQLDYDLFGDVLAFDATYKKNRYRLPVVIFSGVNHHNQTVVFGAAIVSNERKSTYVWLLKQLLIAMKGKIPTSVITDGHQSMAIAIQEVFPNAHHRLCAWHLMRNATSNIHKPQFTKMFTKLMLGDYEVGVFEQKWEEMVGFFGVEDREWIVDMYGKRNMWATAHIRGKFFAGFRTTSRCESLHAVLKRYVKSRHNLTEFVDHFQRCLSYMRHREDLADFKSSTGQPMMQTHFQQLERSASTIYTRQIFMLFRSMLHKASTLKVIYEKETSSCKIYQVSKFYKPNMIWHVSFHEEQVEFKCSCMRMDSIGIPCSHILAVLGFLDIAELPKSLVLRRWTRKAKEGISGYDDMGGLMEDSLAISRRACLAHWAHSGDNNMMEGHAEYMYEDLAKNGSTEIETTRKPKRCSYCRKRGHNIATCSMRKIDESTPQFDDDAVENIEGEDYSFVDAESDEYVHTEWFEEEDEDLDSSRYYEQSGGETEFSMDYDSGGANDDDEA